MVNWYARIIRTKSLLTLISLAGMPDKESISRLIELAPVKNAQIVEKIIKKATQKNNLMKCLMKICAA